MYVAHVTTFDEMSVLLTLYKEMAFGGDGPCDILIDEDSINLDELRTVINRLVKGVFDPDWSPEDYELSDTFASCLFSFVDVLIEWTENKLLAFSHLEYIMPLSKDSGDTLLLFRQ